MGGSIGGRDLRRQPPGFGIPGWDFQDMAEPVMHDFKTCACAVIAVVTLGIAAPPDDPAVAAGEPPAKPAAEPAGGPAGGWPFDGRKALVLEPENFWGWDAAIFGALQERHFDVTYARAEALEDFGSLSRYDLVASDIKRSFTPAQVANLRKYVAEGGALYGSWGGPMGTGDLLRQVCHVGKRAASGSPA